MNLLFFEKTLNTISKHVKVKYISEIKTDSAVNLTLLHRLKKQTSFSGKTLANSYNCFKYGDRIKISPH